MTSPCETGITREQAGSLTNRPADWLARIYGYADPVALAADLPTGAKVLDVGSGCSNLGTTVARLRSDVSWVNLDIRYGEDCEWVGKEDLLRFFLEDYESSGPSNLSLQGGSVDQLPELFPEGHFDRTFSYFMLPHIFIGVSPAAGHRAISHMLRATGEERKASFGPLRWIDPGMISGSGGLEDALDFHHDPNTFWDDGSVTATLPADRDLIPGLAEMVAGHVRH